jgi:hypothetical protein
MVDILPKPRLEKRTTALRPTYRASTSAPSRASTAKQRLATVRPVGNVRVRLPRRGVKGCEVEVTNLGGSTHIARLERICCCKTLHLYAGLTYSHVYHIHAGLF